MTREFAAKTAMSLASSTSVTLCVLCGLSRLSSVSLRCLRFLHDEPRNVGAGLAAFGVCVAGACGVACGIIHRALPVYACQSSTR